MAFINNTEINPNYYYRIKHHLNDGNDDFWYNISSNKDTLHSHCQHKDNAPVYKGSELIELKDIIVKHINVKIIKV